MPIPFGIIYFPPIVANPVEIMNYILSVNMSSSEKICALAELPTMTVETSESNKTCYEYFTLEDSMWHILSFEILQNTKGLFLVLPLGVFFLVFQLGLLEFGFYLLVLNFCPVKSVVVTLIYLILTLKRLDILCKNIPPNIRIIAEAKKRRIKNPSRGFFTFCKINV